MATKSAERDQPSSGFWTVPVMKDLFLGLKNISFQIKFAQIIKFNFKLKTHKHTHMHIHVASEP